MDRDSVKDSFNSYLAEAGKAKGQASWDKNHTLVVHEDVNGDGVIDAATERRRPFDLWKNYCGRRGSPLGHDH